MIGFPGYRTAAQPSHDKAAIPYRTGKCFSRGDYKQKEASGQQQKSDPVGESSQHARQ
jgi:hypothetical protein